MAVGTKHKGLTMNEDVSEKEAPVQELASDLIRLERNGEWEEIARLLEGRVLTAQEMAETAWTLYLNGAFESARHLLLPLEEKLTSPPLAFALAHLRLLEGDMSLAQRFADKDWHWDKTENHAFAFQAALEHAFSESFLQLVERHELKTAERLETLYSAVEPWLDGEKKPEHIRQLSETLLAARLDNEPCLLATTDKNASSECQTILERQAYRLEEIEPFLKADHKTILDIGANVGAFTFLAAQKWPDSRILAFEPGKAAFACLCFNTRKQENVEIFQLGLADRDHNARLQASIVGSMGASIAKSLIDAETSETVDIRDAGRLLISQNIRDIDILKLDTEGCERAILTSMGDLARQARVIYLEYHSEEDRRCLDAMLSSSHHAFSGRILHPHRGMFCYLRSDLAEPWDVFQICSFETP